MKKLKADGWAVVDKDGYWIHIYHKEIPAIVDRLYIPGSRIIKVTITEQRKKRNE